ncbi:unnamed protein product [Camellia sinensis]
MTKKWSLCFALSIIYNDVKIGITQIQSLRSSCNAEVNNRQVLQLISSSLKLELERRTNCQSLKEELERMRIEYLWKEN